MAQEAYDSGDIEPALMFAKYSYFNHVDAGKLEGAVYALDVGLAERLAQAYEKLVKDLQQPTNAEAVAADLTAVKKLLSAAVSKVAAGS